MYATCLHCHGALGANEEIEVFPVGRRLAFDAAKGRLWVICPRCARWNLSPLEERWEAVEWCERAYGETTRRMAAAEIGMARLGSGLEIVRIGRPLRPEFAAWRYGRELDGRHRRAWLRRARQRVEDDPELLALVRGALWLTGSALPLISALSVMGVLKLDKEMKSRRAVNGVRVAGRPLRLTGADLDAVRLDVDPDHGWNLRIPHQDGSAPVIAVGGDAVQLLGRFLSYMNETGGSSAQVQTAVAKIEYFGGGERLLDFMARKSREKRQPLVTALGYEQRLALEMVAHESVEQRAMEGELMALATAWREAEEVADIADNLLVPKSILDRLRGR